MTRPDAASTEEMATYRAPTFAESICTDEYLTSFQMIVRRIWAVVGTLLFIWHPMAWFQIPPFWRYPYSNGMTRREMKGIGARRGGELDIDRWMRHHVIPQITEEAHIRSEKLARFRAAERDDG